MRALPLLLLGVLACEPSEPGPEAEAGAAPAAAATDGMIKGTPPGGLLEWVRDMRAGLEGVPGLEPAAAQKRVLNLYVTRQEYVEMYYGPGGRMEAGETLGAAIEETEARFHALMQLLATPSPADEQVAAGTTAIVDELTRVAAAARADGVRLTPWPDPEAGS